MNLSNINKLNWDSSIELLSSNPKKVTKTITKLIDSNYLSIKDLLWIIPLRVNLLPEEQCFSSIKPNQYFKGRAKLISFDLKPAFNKRNKQKIQLFNITALIQDTKSNSFLNLKWFNSYPNIKNQLEQIDQFTFLGIIQEYKGSLQIINPTLNPKSEKNNILIEYPTINGVSGTHFKNLIQKIPEYLWNEEFNTFSKDLYSKLSIPSITQAFKMVHGLTPFSNIVEYNSKKEDLIYFEFLRDQLKVTVRKMALQETRGNKIEVDKLLIDQFISSFPYQLTPDQLKVSNELLQDFKSGKPMMRIIQGDVGCGKTTVAMISTFVALHAGYQVAIMCPTEALAQQHYKAFSDVISSEQVKITLLTGSISTKKKQEHLNNIEIGTDNLIVGTHSLFQKSVIFKNLGFVVIDEQHKFGVEQRLKLIQKGNGVHTLLMSATPIPRTLQLAQYGDLDISTIKTIPEGRKGTKTRIIKESTYKKFLSFIKTRVELSEQIYIVVPAIEESELMDIKNVDSILKKYQSYFPNLKITALHGQLKPEEKTSTMNSFKEGNIDILISTSVIEVGINVLNATVMAIYDPDRFGLSSLHQLRGRVGRGSKPGFCFLIPGVKASNEALSRLKILENSHDGFVIAEADLKNRGEGNLFGTDQSGNISSYKMASIFEHFDIFEKVKDDIHKVQLDTPELFRPLINELMSNKIISTTV